MNYISELENENTELNKAIDNAKARIDILTKYLTSQKFHCGNDLDGYVNIHDILDALRKIKHELI